MKHAKSFLCALVVWCVAACDDKPPPTPAFVFNRPNQLELVCLNPGGDARSKNTETPFVLPFRCCAGRPALAPTAFFKDLEERNAICGTKTTPVLHALVTQSARGEVAAVNLADEEVLDADQLIPGATFIDVGGLPRAIVSPREVVTSKGEVRGSAWTYVASGEERAVRAVPTCRFQPSGELCDIAEAAPVALPSSPNDMVFHGGALWVSLPESGVIARIKLATPPRKGGSYPAFGEDPVSYFSVPTVTDVDPGEPVSDDASYQFACGAGYDVTFDEPLLLPAAPVVVASGERAEPSRMRVDEETGLLFVADRAQPVVHAFRIDETLTPLTAGLARTGAPIRDFAFTRPVPSSAPTLDDNATTLGVFVDFDPTVNKKGVDAKKVPKFAPNDRRYMYAIDDRDGSVMALILQVDEVTAGVSTTLLRAPTPVAYAAGRADRLGVYGVAAGVATALDVIDTRLINGEYACNPADREDLDTLIEQVDNELEQAVEDLEGNATKLEAAEDALAQLKVDLELAKKAMDEKLQVDLEQKLPKQQKTRDDLAAEVAVLDNERDELDRQLNKLLLLRDAANNNGGDYLRGVFLAVADSEGVLSIYDIHDTDAFCRTNAWCKDKNLSNDSDADPPAVRRHALRRTLAERTPNVNLADAFVALSEGCAEDNNMSPSRGMVPLVRGRRDGKDVPLVCVASDPWAQVSSVYGLQYEGPFFTSNAGVLEIDSNTAEAVLRAAPGLDLCGRGVVSEELGRADGYEGDWLVLLGEPTGEGCTAPEQGREPRLRILKAYDDHLVLDEPKVPASANIDDTSEPEDYPGGFTQLLECYPDALVYQLRLNERFLVDDDTYLHNIKRSDVDGSCVLDDTRDPLLTSRAKAGEFFQNPHLAFRLAKLEKDDPEEGKAPSKLQATLQINGNPEVVAAGIYVGRQQGRTDSLPVLVRFSEQTGDLMVVDSSSQGLRRFLLNGLGSDGAVYR